MLRKIIVSGSVHRNICLVRFSTANDDSKPQEDTNNSHIPIIGYDDPDYLPLPVYTAEINEPLHQRKASYKFNTISLTEFSMLFRPAKEQNKDDEGDKDKVPYL